MSMKKKFAFLLMGKCYNPEKHKAIFETDKQITYILTLNSWDMLDSLIDDLEKKGVGAIELCGAFGKERAEEIIKKTNSKIAVGYVVHNPELDLLFEKFFG